MCNKLSYIHVGMNRRPSYVQPGYYTSFSDCHGLEAGRQHPERQRHVLTGTRTSETLNHHPRAPVRRTAAIGELV